MKGKERIRRKMGKKARVKLRVKIKGNTEESVGKEKEE